MKTQKTQSSEKSAKEKLKLAAVEGVQLTVEDQIAITLLEKEAVENASPETNKPNLHSDEDPFGKRIRAEDILKHHQLNELRQIVGAAIAQHSMALISGPPGVGKTTGVRSVTDELPVNKFVVVYLGQDQTGSNLVRRLAESLGLQPKGFRHNHVLQISRWLIDNLKNGGKEILLVVDEAHLLDDQTLEDLRLLSNADYDRQSPLCIIFLAQPWLRARLKSPFFEPLTQRLRYRYTLEGLAKTETENYILSRLAAAGLDSALFSPDAIQHIFAHSEGIPRRINNLCSHLLLKARAKDLPTIDASAVRAIADLLDS